MGDEQEIKRLKKINERLERKQKNSGKRSVILTPHPISNCVIGNNVEGPILRYMFCATGKITKGLIRLSEQIKDGARVDFTIYDDIGNRSKSYIMPRRNLIIEPDFKVFSGDRLILSIFPESSTDKITEVWVSFLWVPDVKETEIKRFLINELLEEGGEDEIIEEG